jgi:hypothetical protein
MGQIPSITLTYSGPQGSMSSKKYSQGTYQFPPYTAFPTGVLVGPLTSYTWTGNIISGSPSGKVGPFAETHWNTSRSKSTSTGMVPGVRATISTLVVAPYTGNPTP